MCHKGAYSALSHTFSPPSHLYTCSLSSSLFVGARPIRLPFPILASLTPKAPAREQHTHCHYWIPLLRTCFVLTPSTRAVLVTLPPTQGLIIHLQRIDGGCVQLRCCGVML